MSAILKLCVVRQGSLRLQAIAALDLARRMPNHVAVSSPPHAHKVKIAAIRFAVGTLGEKVAEATTVWA